MNSNESDRMFHIFDPDAWDTFQASGAEVWEPPSLAAEGFVHLSFESQLAGTLSAHYSHCDEVHVVEVTIRDEGLVIEPSRGGELFPHLYRGLSAAEITRSGVLRRQSDSEWEPVWEAT